MKRCLLIILLSALLLIALACGSSGPSATETPAPISDVATAVTQFEPVEPDSLLETAVPPTSTSQPTQPTATQMRAYALDAANLLSLVDMGQPQSLSPGVTVNGRITPENLAIPYATTAQAGDVLLIELLLPNLPDQAMHTVRPAVFIADPTGSEIGYMHGGIDFVTTGERRSIAQASFIAPASGSYIILATLDGHQNPAQNELYEADFELTVTAVPSLPVNETLGATRQSTERHVYAVTVAAGEFNLVYEETSGTPPGQFALAVSRLGSPVDGLALQEIMASTGAFNQTFPFLDNAYAAIAERMGLARLTYLIFVQSFTLTGQEQTTYTSNYRLTVMQQSTVATIMGTATPVVDLPFNPGDETWNTRLNHPLHVQFQIPAGWEVASGSSSYYSQGNASLSLVPEALAYTDTTAACQGMTQGIAAAAFGVGTGEVITVNGVDVCILSRPESGEPYRVIIKYPQPVENNGSIGPRGVWNFLRMDIEPADYFWRIVESITFPDEPSAQLYVSGVVDILQADYYFRDQIDWAALAFELDNRLDDESTLDDAYDALGWLMDEMAASVNHHHMGLRNPEQVQDALRGEQRQVGLQMVGNVVALVFPNSPAAAAGLQMGDKLIRVNGVPFAAAKFNTDSFDLLVERDGSQFEGTLVGQKISYLLPPRSQRLGDVAYLETFGIFGAGLPLLQEYAATVHSAIKALDSANTCGWILDLRRNTGGSIHAIMAGIAPFVGEGELYRIRWQDGHEDVTIYQNGRVFGVGTSDLPTMVNTPYQLRSPNPPLAVLVSQGTGSVGEMSAIAVNGRLEAQSRIFGEQTPGLTTPVFFASLYDGGLFYAPIQLVVDLEGRTYLEGVIPDESLPVVYDARYGTKDDPVVQAALAWLESEHHCSP